MTTSGTSHQSRTAWLVRRPMVAFTVIAYVISGLCWLPLLADRQD